MAATPIVEHRFSCSCCGASAGLVTLVTDRHRIEIVRDSFTSRLTLPVLDTSLATWRDAIQRGDAATLYRLDREVASFFCPACAACYCGDHWRRRDIFDEDGWHDSIRGTCPEGHDRMVED